MLKKKKIYPEKTTLNLAIKDRPPYYYRAITLGALIGIILIGAFTKFAVIDRINAANSLEREAAQERMRYEQLVRENTVYSELRLEYEKYFKQISGEEISDCMDALRLIEDVLMENAAVRYALLSKNTLSVELTGIDLERVSEIVKLLYSHELVSAASISSADTTVEGTYSSISMAITLTVKGGDGK